MITFRRTCDYRLIHEILTDPSIFPTIGDDFTPSIEEWNPVVDSRLWYVLAYDFDLLLGLFMFIQQSTVLYEMHVALLPEGRGKPGFDAGAGVVAWIFQGTPCRRIVGAIPAFNRPAFAYALRIGMQTYGVNEKAFMKNGALVDLVLVGISRAA